MNLSFVRPVFADMNVGAHAAGLPDPVGWAGGSLIRTIRHVVLTTAVGWQIVMALAAVGTLGPSGWPLATAFLCLGVFALLTRRHPSAAPVIPLGMAGLALAGHLASADISSALVFAACWQINIASGLAALSILRRYAMAFVFAQAVAIAVTLMIVLPDWGVQFPLAIIATQVAIVAAIRMGLQSLFRLAAETDTSAAAAEQNARQALLAKRLSSQIAEESRVLHDTAINTLGAIANGGAGTSDARRVVEQCESDIALLRGLRSERRPLDRADLLDIFSSPGLPILRSGLDDRALAQTALLLPTRTIDGLVRAIGEAVTNATKHSGASQIEIDAATSAHSLTVTVKDLGVGFSAEAPPGRGIDNSIRARARDFGFDAHILSNPGTGTTVTFVVQLGDSGTSGMSQRELDEDLPEMTSALLRRAASLWSLGVAIISIVLTAIGGTNHYLALYPMIGVMLLAWFIARNAGRRVRRILPALLIVATCVIFFLSAAATAFGTDGAVHWQALAPTGAFVMILASRPGRRTVRVSSAVWIGVVAALALAALTESVAAAQIVLIAGCVGWGFAAMWSTFQAMVERLSGELAQSRLKAFTARLSLEADAAAQKSYRRWVDAGLDSAVDLLKAIADGSRDPHAASTQRDCGLEERYLRQLVQIGPELVYLGREMLPALLQARTKGIDFVLRLGTEDTPDDELARRIASVVLNGIAATPAGKTLVVSLYPVHEGLQLTLVGPGLASLDVSASRVRVEELGELDLLELTYFAMSAQVPPVA